MDEKKKIILGEKDILSKSNEDLFINLSLSKTFSEIRNDKFENIFDVDKQFKKERNASRDFRIYGIVDSTIVDCDNLSIFIYESAISGTGINSGTTVLSGLLNSITSSSLVYNGLNSYGKKRGKYLIELTGYTKDFVYIQIPTNSFSYKDQVYSQQLIFRDADGNFVDYGTQTIDITENGDAIEINNDFYFLYNKHWIKKDLNIVEEKPAKISFSSPETTIVAESNSANTQFSVMLDKPSPFGLESVILTQESATLSAFGSEINIQDTISTYYLPLALSFSAGEQIKTFSFFSSGDTIQEFTENIVLGLSGFQFVQTASPLTHTIFVTDSTPRNNVTLNFQNVYQNRNYFTGIVRKIATLNYSYPLPAVLRNGLKFEGSPMEFYPADNFILKIKNLGNNTILPANASLGIASEQIFQAGQQISFSINTKYQNTQKHSVKFYFANINLTTTTSVPYLYSYDIGLLINGIPVFDFYKTYKIDYEKFLAAFTNSPVASMSNTNTSGWNRYNLEIPFDVAADLSAKTITITAKNAGTRLDITPYGGFPDIFDATDTQLVSFGLTAETIQDFVYSAQTPLEIILAANTGSNYQAYYEFELSKPGFDTMTFSCSPLAASPNSTTYYLAAGYHDILRNWDNSTNVPVYVHSGVTSNWPFSYFTTGLYTSGEAYVNGILFLSNRYFDNTQNTATYTTGNQALNLSHFTNASGDFRADFEPSPISTIAATSEYYSPQNSRQSGYLAIGSVSSLSPGDNPFRSFDFRTGFTGSFTTFYTSQYNYNALTIWPGPGAGVASSGSVVNSTTIGLKKYLQDGYLNLNITSQGLSGANPVTASEYTQINNAYGTQHQLYDFIKLESLTSGNPFEITNINDMKKSDGSLLISGGSVNFYPFVPNEVLGITINEANNHMGGYSLTHP